MTELLIATAFSASNATSHFMFSFEFEFNLFAHRVVEPVNHSA
jgi:hypothetical protein